MHREFPSIDFRRSAFTLELVLLTQSGRSSRCR